MNPWIIVGMTWLAILAFGYGHYCGWNAGVKDTERRWSDAVGRSKGIS